MRWSNRSMLYKSTLVSLYFVFLVYGLAFGVPTWFGNANMFKGLWLQCGPVRDDVDFDNCTTVAFGDDNSDWMDGVRGVWTAGAAFYLLAVLMSICGNFCCGRNGTKDYGVTAIWALIAGLDGAAGVIVVAVKTADDAALNSYRWGYFLACVASGLTVVLSIMLFLTRNVDATTRPSRPSDYSYSGNGKPYANGGGYANGGYLPHRDDVPLHHHGGGVYPAHPAPQYSLYRGADPAMTSLGRPQRQQSQPGGYGNGYQPYGYPGARGSVAESADLSNGYTAELIQAEHSLARSHRAAQPHDDYPYRRY